ncbi:MAG TPA: molybdopterin-dependent oxidoreductase, partial [Myxococcaceae bacterium]|nr:molybdopterin-dependent oxidoreductase [Myxococcaceae bacterium]
MREVRRFWTPSLWASWKPFGVGEQRPNAYREMWRAFWENRDRLGYAWRILRHGVCDGCGLGTKGMRDWTIDGVHLCAVRLRLLRLNTQPELDPAILGDVRPLEAKTSAELRALGRLAWPFIRRRGEKGFQRVSWEEALEATAQAIRSTEPDRTGYYLTSRGIGNEIYYAAQKAVRAMGTNSIDNAARVCHSPSTVALKQAVGAAATTCSYKDWIGTDLIVFVGSNVANNQPVAMKYLHYAKKAGTRVAVVNTYREPGMERYWVPSNVESALFGTRIADRFFLVHTGGDVPFFQGVLKHLLERGLVDREFIELHTTGFEEVENGLNKLSWAELEQLSGASRQEMEALAQMIAEARRAVFVWSMGVTQHAFGEDNVRAIINLALARGFVGREGCGLMPIRGHSGVQGGAEMGAYASVFPGGVPINPQTAEALSQFWGFEVPSKRGMTAPEMIDAAFEERLDV